MVNLNKSPSEADVQSMLIDTLSMRAYYEAQLKEKQSTVNTVNIKK